MNILKFTAKTIAVAGVVVTLAAAPSFALYSECVGEDTDYPELSTTQSKDYPIKCVTVTDGEAVDPLPSPPAIISISAAIIQATLLAL